MILQPVLVGSLLIDTDSVISPAEAKIVASAGIKGIIGYLGLVTPAMLAGIFDAGLGFIPVSFDDHAEGWTPTAAMGTAEGGLARRRARALGLLPGISTCCDLEGMGGKDTDTENYAVTWCASASPDGDIPTAYVGAGIPLNPQQLYELPFKGYMRSCSEVPNIAVCGYQLIQLFPPNLTAVNGVKMPWPVDVDVTQQDKRGRAPVWQIAR